MLNQGHGVMTEGNKKRTLLLVVVVVVVVSQIRLLRNLDPYDALLMCMS